MALGRISRAMFAVAFVAVFVAMAVESPRATSQSGYYQRMTFMHQNPQLHFSLLDTAEAPNPGTPTVGKFVGATAQSSQLVEGHAWPGPQNPEYMYGFTRDGTTLRTVGVTGTPIQSVDFSNTFSRITGAWLFTNNVPSFPFNTVPRCYDLKEHFVMVGEVNQTNPSMAGNSTAIMLINPGTMAGYKVGAASQFFGPTSTSKFEDCAAAVWPGPDGNYATATDNEYRYAMAYVLSGSGLGGLGVLSLNYSETMNGQNPPNPWNPIPQERGPDYTNVYPKVDANSKWGTTSIGGVVDNGQVYVRTWYARPGIPGFGNATDRSYCLLGSVIEIPGIPTVWRPRLHCFDLGQQSVTNVPITAAYTGGPPWHPFCKAYLTSDIFKSMVVVGDWVFSCTGDGLNGDGFGDQIEMTYIPEMADGAGDLDDGYRGSWSPGTSSAGHAGAFLGTNFSVQILYFGTGIGASTAYGTIRSVYQDWAPNIAGAGSGMTPIDFHTEEEKLLGLNVRQAPQPFTGYFQSIDPADTFPGAFGGQGNGKGGGCSKSATGAGTDGLLVATGALLAMAALLVRTVRS